VKRWCLHDKAVCVDGTDGLKSQEAGFKSSNGPYGTDERHRETLSIVSIGGLGESVRDASACWLGAVPKYKAL